MYTLTETNNERKAKRNTFLPVSDVDAEESWNPVFFFLIQSKKFLIYIFSFIYPSFKLRGN